MQKQKDTKNKNQYNIPTSKFGAAFVVILALISIAVFFYFSHKTWQKTWWTTDDGDALGLTKLLKLIGDSPKNFLIYLVLPLGLCGLNAIFVYPLNKGKNTVTLQTIMSIIFGLSCTAMLVLYIIWLFNESSMTAFWMNFACCSAIITGSPFGMLMAFTCDKCGTFGMKVNTKTVKNKSYSTHHVSGGYETVSADIKDETGSKVGTLETQVYRPAHSYTSSKTTTTKTYVCKVCGNVTQSTSTT